MVQNHTYTHEDLKGILIKGKLRPFSMAVKVIKVLFPILTQCFKLYSITICYNDELNDHLVPMNQHPHFLRNALKA